MVETEDEHGVNPQSTEKAVDQTDKPVDQPDNVDQQDKPVDQPDNVDQQDKPTNQSDNPKVKPDGKKRVRKTLVLKGMSLKRQKMYEDAVSCTYKLFEPVIFDQ